MKKIMETRFHFVGTLEEAEFNRVVSSSNPGCGLGLIRSSLPEGTGIMAR
jgi:hypothetical protein